MVVESSDSKLKLKLLKVLSGHKGQIFRIKWSSSSEFLASPSSDNTVKLWNPILGLEKGRLVGHENEVNSVAWSPTEDKIATVSDDFTIRVWDVKSSKTLTVIKHHTDEINDIAWSPDGEKLASVGDDKNLVITDSTSGDLIKKLKLHMQTIWTVAWSKSGKWIATGSDDEKIRLFNVETEEKRVLRGHNSTVRSVCWFSDEKHLVSGARDGKVIIWNIDFPDQIHSLQGHSDLVTSVSVSHDDALVASKSKDDTVRIWDCNSLETIDLIHEKGGDRWPCGISFSPIDNVLATLGEEDTVIRIWKYIPQPKFIDVNKDFSKPKSIFISYSRKDKVWLDLLLQMLTPLTRKSDFKIWSDVEIKTGDQWKEKLDKELNESDIALLLVTPSFLASSFIFEVELPRLLDKEKVIWLPIRHSLHEEIGLDKFQSSWDPANPLSQMDKDDQEFQLAKLARELRELTS